MISDVFVSHPVAIALCVLASALALTTWQSWRRQDNRRDVWALGSITGVTTMALALELA